MNTDDTTKLSRKDPDRGLVFNIQKFSLHDGAGIRTLVFLKGCPLKCEWCANPEGQSYSPELAYNPAKCIGLSECDWCMRTCKREAIRESSDGKVEIDRESCDNCGDCVEACPSKALELFGESMSVDEVIQVVEEDSSFYARSDGGLTLSGGEPMSQIGFVEKVLKTAQSRGIDTAIETTGHCDWENLERACQYVNHVFFDVKSMDDGKHKIGAGVGNSLILDNLKRLCDKFKDILITVRTPVVPDFNDSVEDIVAIAEFLDGLSRPCEYELLPYHRFGESKYQHFGKNYPLHEINPPLEERMKILRQAIQPYRKALDSHI